MNIDFILEYNGNSEEFEKYRIDLQKPFNYEVLYYDNKKGDKKKIKYKGNILNNLYDGRGILYDEYGDIKYNGYFKNGKYDGFGKEKRWFGSYEGFFINGEYNGKGIIYKENKEKKKIYEGNFLNGEYDGVGIEYYEIGNTKRKAIYSKGKICKECYGILYNENGNEIYKGILHDGKPKEGKGISIYNYNYHSYNDDLIYKGDFLDFKYNGNGILYYEEKNKIKFEGLFKDDLYVKGILYDEDGYKKYEGEFINNIYEGEGILFFKKNNKPYCKGNFIKGEFIDGILYGLNGEIIYKGDFKNKIPKEGKSLSLYNLNGKIYYKGDFYDYKGKVKQYDDSGNIVFKGEVNELNEKKGIVYLNSIKKYEGELINDKYDGYGKLYELDGDGINYLYYEGYFKNNEIFGKGIKYYRDGSIKIEGNFDGINSYNGIYYSPNKKIIFNGEISQEIPIESKQLILYNDNGNLIYDYKFYNDKENGFKIIYDNNNNYPYIRSLCKVVFISDGYTGKTNLLERLVENRYPNTDCPTSTDYYLLKYEFKNQYFINHIVEISGHPITRKIGRGFYKNADIFIIVFDLSMLPEEDFIDILITEIKEEVISNYKEKIIYLVGNKLDITEEYLDIHRKRAKIAIDSGIIHKYFEVSAKTGKGINFFSNVLIRDCININNNVNNKKIHDESAKLKKSKNLNDNKKFEELNKYINY